MADTRFVAPLSLVLFLLTTSRMMYCFLYVLMMFKGAPCMGLVVPFCAIPFGSLILFLVFLFCSLYLFCIYFDVSNKANKIK